MPGGDDQKQDEGARYVMLLRNCHLRAARCNGWNSTPGMALLPTEDKYHSNTVKSHMKANIVKADRAHAANLGSKPRKSNFSEQTDSAQT